MEPDKAAALLAEEIIDEARKEAEKIVKDAEKERKTILDSAKISAREREMWILKEAEKKVKKTRDQILAEGRMKIKREFLRKREELIEQALEELKQALKKRTKSKEYEQFLFRTAETACNAIESPKVILYASEQDLKRLEARLPQLSKKTNKEVALGRAIRTIGGIRAESSDGAVVVDETLESRLRREQERLRVEIAKMIFEGSR